MQLFIFVLFKTNVVFILFTTKKVDKSKYIDMSTFEAFILY